MKNETELFNLLCRNIRMPHSDRNRHFTVRTVVHYQCRKMWLQSLESLQEMESKISSDVHQLESRDRAHCESPERNAAIQNTAPNQAHRVRATRRTGSPVCESLWRDCALVCAGRELTARTRSRGDGVARAAAVGPPATSAAALWRRERQQRARVECRCWRSGSEGRSHEQSSTAADLDLELVHQQWEHAALLRLQQAGIRGVRNQISFLKTYTSEAEFNK